MWLERLESRINLSTAAFSPMGDAASGAGADTPWPASVVAPSFPEIAALTAATAAAAAAFTMKNRAWTTSVELVVPSLPDATSLRLEAVGGLASWNGRKTPLFVPTRANVRIDLSLGGETLPIHAGEMQPHRAAALTLNAATTNRVTARITVPGRPGRAPAAGWYAVATNVATRDSGPSTPVTFMFSVGAVPAGSRVAALRAVGGVGPEPTAVTIGVALAPPPVVAASPAPQAAFAAVSSAEAVPPAAVQSLTEPAASSFALPPAVNGIVEVSTDITSNATFAAGTTYVITAEVHVVSGVTLTIEDGVEVRIRNGTRLWRNLTASALVFDAGSSLLARNVVFHAANDANERVDVADNGGVFFCGGTRVATKDGISSRNLERRRIGWSFVAESITASFLGRRDPVGGDGDGTMRDDIDAVSVIGAVFEEWRVKAVTVNRSGDDGFDLTNASIAMDAVKVFDPVEDGLNLTTSLLQIGRLLEVEMTDSTAPDREIFDFEVDTGPATIQIFAGAAVDIRGFWDNSRSDLRIYVSSSDMPQPSLARERYVFTGTLAEQASIYSRA